MEIERLETEHAELRRLADDIGRAVGRQVGVGWDDRTDCDRPRLRAALELFMRTLAGHERAEEALLQDAVRRGLDGGIDFRREIESAHGGLEGMMRMLQTVSALCDGRHVHAVRAAAARLREDLEAHLVYEERVLFPRLRVLRAGSAR